MPITNAAHSPHQLHKQAHEQAHKQATPASGTKSEGGLIPEHHNHDKQDTSVAKTSEHEKTIGQANTAAEAPSNQAEAPSNQAEADKAGVVAKASELVTPKNLYKDVPGIDAKPLEVRNFINTAVYLRGYDICAYKTKPPFLFGSDLHKCDYAFLFRYLQKYNIVEEDVLDKIAHDIIDALRVSPLPSVPLSRAIEGFGPPTHPLSGLPAGASGRVS